MSRPKVSGSGRGEAALDRPGVGVGDELLELRGVGRAIVEESP